jgi:DNA repair photolyase
MSLKKNSLIINSQDNNIRTKNNQKDKSQTKKIVISASRRTDIPAFYLDWFMNGIKQGFFNVTNPYNKITKKIDARPDIVHTIVFWSKNYAPFLKTGIHDELKQMGYNLFFHFSINSESSMLEPGVPSLDERLLQLERLCNINDSKNIVWRFDPVCYYRARSGVLENNLSDFAKIAEKASELGMTRCITSFADKYRKIERRVQFLQNNGKNVPVLEEIGQEKKLDIIRRMTNLLEKKGIELSLCCEREVFSDIKEKENISESSCISGKLFGKLFKGDLEAKRDYGQRASSGCKCSKSVDIGSYEQHPCFHNCIFCYANPAIDQEIKKDR